MRDFIYNGISASHFGLRISSNYVYGGPERLATDYLIPGKLPKVYTQYENKMNPKVVQYDVALMRSKDLETDTAAIKRWLMAEQGYHRLEDTYQPSVYRMARYDGPFDPDLIGSALRSIKVPLTFSCQPQLWLKSGDQWHEVSSALGGLNLVNPTGFTAYPLIRLNFDTSETTESEVTITFWDGVTFERRGAIKVPRPTGLASRVVYVDCETQECWRDDDVSYNDKVIFSGDNSITGSVRFAQSDETSTQVSIRPRWWRW